MQKRKTTPSAKRIGVSLVALAIGTSFAVGFFTDSETFAQWKASTTQITNAEITTADWSSDVAPTITNQSFPNATKGEDYSVTITGEGTSAIYTIASGSLPQGLNLNDTTGVISGKPTGHGVSTFTLAKTNILGSVSKELSINVRYAAPTLTSSTLPEAKKGNSYSYTLAGTGEEVSYSITSGALPAGLSLNPSTGVVSGTPTITGDFAITVTKSNESGTVIKALTMKVTLAAPVITTDYRWPDGYLTIPYELAIAATGEEIVYTASNMPAGLSINPSTGVISGIPTETGAILTRITATNSGGTFSSQFLFSVNYAPPTIVTSSLPDGEVGLDYSGVIERTGEQTTLRVTGNLPPGVTINGLTGTLSGKPTQSGTFTFNAILSNNGGTVQRTFSIYIETDGPVISTTTLPAATQGITYNQTLAGKGEDPSYSITAGALPTGLSLNATTGRILGTPSGHGISTFTVTKTNAKGTAVRELSINVLYQAPTITTNSFTNARLNTNYSATLTGVGNGATFTISEGTLPPGISINGDTGALTGSATSLGAYTFTINKTNEGGTATKQFTLTVVHVAPKFVTTSLPSATIGVYYEFKLDVTGLDVDYSIVVGSFVDGLSFDPTTATISGTPTITGSGGTLRIRATNSGGYDDLIASLIVNHVAPTIITTALPAGQVGTPYSYQIETTGEALTFSRISGGSGLPAGLTLSATGVISGTPGSTYSGTFGVTVQNSGGNASKTWAITIVTQAPTITTETYPDAILGNTYSQPLLGAGTGNTYSITAGAVPTGTVLNAGGTVTGSPNTHGLFTFTITKTNVSGSVSKEFTIYVRYATPTISTSTLANASLNVAYTGKLLGTGAAVTHTITDGSLPPGFSINATTGDITGTSNTSGTYTFTVLKKNVDGEVSKQLSIMVAQAPPTFGTAVPGSVYEDQYYEYAFGGTGEEVTYAITSAAQLPTGLSLNTSTGVISGTTNVLGTTAVTVSKTNSGGSVTKNISIVVKIAIPVITTTSYANATIGVAYSQTIVATGKSVTFAVAGGGGALPGGLTLNTATGVISGTPTAAGSFTFTLNATNSSGTSQLRVPLAVNQVAPVLTTTAFNIPTKNASFSQTLTATGVAVTWSFTGLPAGITQQSNSGTISGTPSVYGTFPVTVSVTNTGGTSTKTMNMLVEPRVPVITTTAIPSGAVGVPYSFTMTNSTDPGEWSLLTGGTLPAGLTLNATTGVISGTPTTAGDKTFTIIVENSNNDASKQFTMTINVAPPVITRTSLPNVAKGVAYSQAVTTTGTGITFTRSAGTLPTGLALNATTGVISGTSTGAGDYNFTITATNAGGAVSKAFTIRILQSTQLVLNGGFESGMTNWAWRIAGGDVAVGSSPSNTGSKTGARYARVYDGYLNSDKIAVTPGETVTLKFAYRNVGIVSQSQAYYGLLYSDDFGNEIDVFYKVDASTVWGAKTVDIVIPADYKYAQVYFSGDYAAGATTVYDDVTLTGLR